MNATLFVLVILVTCFMSSSTKSVLASLLKGLAWLFFAIAGLAFWLGGRAINEFARTERMLAEMEGIALAVVCLGLGAVVKSAGENLTEYEEESTPTTQASSKKSIE